MGWVGSAGPRTHAAPPGSLHISSGSARAPRKRSPAGRQGGGGRRSPSQGPGWGLGWGCGWGAGAGSGSGSGSGAGVGAGVGQARGSCQGGGHLGAALAVERAHDEWRRRLLPHAAAVCLSRETRAVSRSSSIETHSSSSRTLHRHDFPAGACIQVRCWHAGGGGGALGIDAWIDQIRFDSV